MIERVKNKQLASLVKKWNAAFHLITSTGFLIQPQIKKSAIFTYEKQECYHPWWQFWNNSCKWSSPSVEIEKIEKGIETRLGCGVELENVVDERLIGYADIYKKSNKQTPHI